MRLGKRERQRQAVIKANVATMRDIQQEYHLFGGHNRWTRSSADHTELLKSTHTGYRDSVHSKSAGRPNSGSCRIDRK